jgi:hypothetical protein
MGIYRIVCVFHFKTLPYKGLHRLCPRRMFAEMLELGVPVIVRDVHPGTSWDPDALREAIATSVASTAAQSRRRKKQKLGLQSPKAPPTVGPT